MTKEPMRKWKIAVGICGPTILYSNVIKAKSAEEAVDKYIADSEGKYTISSKETLLQHVHEIEKRKVNTGAGGRTSMKDYDLNEVKVGNQVAFICAQTDEHGYKRFSIQKGTIKSFSDSSAVIDCADLEKTFRIIETSGRYTGNNISEYRLKKVALMKKCSITANDSVPVDALGQELKVGDVVAYMDDINQGSCAGLIKGTVTKITAKLVEMDGSKRKTRDKVVKLKSGK